ncbi:hypothetical protein Misp06_04459 [Microbulbifer sp. NBRC 101763]
MFRQLSRNRKVLSVFSIGVAVWCISMLGYQISYAERVMSVLESCIIESLELCEKVNEVELYRSLWNGSARYYALASVFFCVIYGATSFGERKKRVE